MKIIILVFLISFTCLSQDLESKMIMEQVSKKEEGESNFVFVIESQGYEKISKLLNDKNYIAKLNLSKTDLKFLISQVATNRNYRFSKTLFENAIAIPQDSVMNYSARKYKMWEDDMKRIIASQHKIEISEFKRVRGYPCLDTWINFFSKPLFNLDKNLCLIFHAKLCDISHGVGGCDGVAILRKNGNSWIIIDDKYVGCY